MATATFQKYEKAIIDFAAGTHAACLNADTDTLKVALSNTAPDLVNDIVFSTDAAEIAAGNGYTAGGDDITNTATRTTSVITVVGQDLVILASGGPIAQWRYVVLYNSTNDKLIGVFDYGSAVDLADGEQVTIDFGAVLFTLG